MRLLSGIRQHRNEVRQRSFEMRGALRVSWERMCWDRHVQIGYDDAMTPFMQHRAGLEDGFDGMHDASGGGQSTAHRSNVSDVVG